MVCFPEHADPLPHPDCAARRQVIDLDTGDPQEKNKCRPRNYSCAEPMRRVFSNSVLQCPRCGGHMRILAAIHPPKAIREILACHGLPTKIPPDASALPDTDEAALRLAERLIRTVIGEICLG